MTKNKQHYEMSILPILLAKIERYWFISQQWLDVNELSAYEPVTSRRLQLLGTDEQMLQTRRASVSSRPVKQTPPFRITAVEFV